MKLQSLEQAAEALQNLKESDQHQVSSWTSYQHFVHCSKTIEYSMTGYPQLKPVLIRNTVGKIAIRKFLKQGYMSHDLTADVAGSVPVQNVGTFDDGKQILLSSIAKFQGYQGSLKPHLLFGNMTKKAYDTYFAIHLADHLSGIL